MKSQLLTPLHRFFLRTPLFPVSLINQKLNKAQHSVFEEAVYLASPQLYEETKKTNHTSKDQKKMAESMYKYKTRSSMRCTPFGLFAGCLIGEMADHTKIDLVDITQYRPCTRLDMDYICHLIQHLEKLPVIQQQVKWYVNETIYKLGGKYRYVEYFYVGTFRKHRISSVEDNPYLRKILKLSEKGVQLNILLQFLQTNGIETDEAKDYISQLIDAQILKSELEVAVTGPNPIDLLIEKLKKMDGVGYWYENIIQIHDIIRSIRHISADNIKKYESIIDIIKQLGVPFNPKHLFQVDLFIPVKSATISKSIVEDVNQTVSFLSQICPNISNSNLTYFQNSFYERYEDQQISLLQALDVELGIGYPVRANERDSNELLNGLYFPHSAPKQDYSVNTFQTKLLNNIIKILHQGKTEVKLEEIDFNPNDSERMHMTDIVTVAVSVIKDDNEERCIHIKSIGGDSGAYLIGRFGHLDSQILSHMQEITALEQENNKNVIMAEIVHLPESRAGNILLRPIVRNYEIPILTQGGVEREYQIPLSDLYLSVKYNRLILFSKTLNKEIIPRLTTAHNYTFNALPVYHFLCDMQSQGKNSAIYFDLGKVINSFRYVPRISHRNCIISRQKWKIEKSDVESLLKYGEKNEEWRLIRNIPRFVLLLQNENELLIDFENKEALSILIQQVKRDTQIFVEEFLFMEQYAIVESDNDKFWNEIIFSFYNNQNKKR